MRPGSQRLLAAAGPRLHGTRSLGARLVRAAGVTCGSAALTLLCFMVLPLIQAIAQGPSSDTTLRPADVASAPPPPAPPEPEPEKEPEQEEEPPELQENQQPLDLSQMELALSAGAGGGWMRGDFGIDLGRMAQAKKDVEALFSEADLDQKPRAIHQPSPVLTAELRRHAPGRAVVVFEVDTSGRVQNPIVQKSSDPVFEQPAAAAVKKWKFEPGKRRGEPVRFRMRVPLVFK